MKKINIFIITTVFLFKMGVAQLNTNSLNIEGYCSCSGYTYSDYLSYTNKSLKTGFVYAPALKLVKIDYYFGVDEKYEKNGSKRENLVINFYINTYNTETTVSWGSQKEPILNYTTEKFVLDENSFAFTFDLYYDNELIGNMDGTGNMTKPSFFNLNKAYDINYVKRFPILKKIIDDKYGGHYALRRFTLRNGRFKCINGIKYNNFEMMMSKYVEYLCETKRLNKCKDPKEEEKRKKEEEAKKNKSGDDDFWNGNDTKKNTTSQSNNNKNLDSFWDGNSSSADNQKSNTDKNDGDFDWDGATDADFKANYKAVQQNGLWGFVNDKGKLVINYQYESAQDFINNLAVVGIRDNDRKILYGVINGKNKYIVKPIYNSIEWLNDGTLKAKKFDHFGEYIENSAFYDCQESKKKRDEEDRKYNRHVSYLILSKIYRYIRAIYNEIIIIDKNGNVISKKIIKDGYLEDKNSDWC